MLAKFYNLVYLLSLILLVGGLWESSSGIFRHQQNADVPNKGNQYYIDKVGIYQRYMTGVNVHS